MQLPRPDPTPTHRMGLLDRVDAGSGKGSPHGFVLCQVRELLVLFPGTSHQQLGPVPGPSASEIWWSLTGERPPRKEVLRHGTLRAQEQILVPQGTHELLLTGLVGL